MKQTTPKGKALIDLALEVNNANNDVWRLEAAIADRQADAVYYHKMLRKVEADLATAQRNLELTKTKAAKLTERLKAAVL